MREGDGEFFLCWIGDAGGLLRGGDTFLWLRMGLGGGGGADSLTRCAGGGRGDGGVLVLERNVAGEKAVKEDIGEGDRWKEKAVGSGEGNRLIAFPNSKKSNVNTRRTVARLPTLKVKSCLVSFFSSL